MAVRETSSAGDGRGRGGSRRARSARELREPAGEQNAAFFGALQSYRLFGRLVDDLLELAELQEPWAGKARFALHFMVDAMAPTNILPGNPAALKRAFDTGGLSLAKGMR